MDKTEVVWMVALFLGLSVIVSLLIGIRKKDEKEKRRELKRRFSSTYDENKKEK